MTPAEILTEIQKLPPGEIQKVSNGVNELLDKDDLEKREQEFANIFYKKAR